MLIVFVLGCSIGLSGKNSTVNDEIIEEPSEEVHPWDTDTTPEPNASEPGIEPDAVDTDLEDTGDTGNLDDTDVEDTGNPLLPCTLDVYDEARDYASQYPLRDGDSWSGWCASLMWRFAQMPESSARPSAILAYEDSMIESLDPRLAPIGAFHWWDIGVYGHVAIDLLGGGTTVFMASNYVLEDWGDAIGVTSIPRYTNSSGATYLGWSMDYAGTSKSGGGGQVCDASFQYNGVGTVPISSTQESGVPNSTFYMRMQLLASQNGYTGPIDGVLGSNSWRGVQTYLASQGFLLSVTGNPDSNTYSAMQQVASMYGYTGPVDGIMGPNSYRGFARFLNETL